MWPNNYNNINIFRKFYNLYYFYEMKLLKKNLPIMT